MVNVVSSPGSAQIWQTWNHNTTTASTIQAGTWQSWIQSSSSSITVTNTWGIWNETYEETLEQQQQREQRERDQAAARAARRAEQETAHARAEELLLSLLTDEQAASYTEHGWFEVRGNRGGRWRIRRRGQAGNVDLMPEIGEVREATFCCHPPDHLPNADAHVAQMLHLVTDEDGFRRTANRVHGHLAAA